MATTDFEILRSRIAFHMACDRQAFAEQQYRAIPTAENLQEVLNAARDVRETRRDKG